MKKLIIAMAAIASVAVVNAATINWTCPYGIANATEEGSTTAVTAYLIDTAKLTQSTIYTSLIEGKTMADSIGDNYVKTVSLSDGGMSPQTFASPFTDGNTASLYMAVFDSDLKAVYFSETIEKTMLSVGNTKYSFSADSSVNAIAANMTGFDASAGGWVSASVPEPTSAMLLMLGLCGLALKRKNA